ncbi:hypothetical protein [Microbacterium pseudoresistens]|uniref:Twin-arginine translocation signal domain-containing protein n=1 Tax=Microbacterium pseudoresistens TaxID=640634 RepID=A0A7Y9JMP5_9MICO|nr:hypothetical protein [Microbacterium pseudoresistens]NYD54565.1 hypothetical protein [Microbacterium pseudoresistens]
MTRSDEAVEPARTSRRSFLTAAAWSAPVVAAAVAVPARAASVSGPTVRFSQMAYVVPMPPGGEVAVSGWLLDEDGQPKYGQVAALIEGSDFEIVGGAGGSTEVYAMTSDDGSFRLRVRAKPSATVASHGGMHGLAVDGGLTTSYAGFVPAPGGTVSLTQPRTNMNFVNGRLRAVVEAHGISVPGPVTLTFALDSGVFTAASVSVDASPQTGWTITGVGTGTLSVARDGGLAADDPVVVGVLAGYSSPTTGSVHLSTVGGELVTPSQPVPLYFG